MNRWRSFLHPLIRLLLSIGIVILFSAVLLIFRSYLSISVIALLYLVPVVISAAILGRTAGITASVLSFLVFNYLFVFPFYTLLAEHPQDFLAMVVLLGVAILFSSLMARIQSNLAQVQAREHEATQLYELSVMLAGKNDQAVIARTLAQHLAGLFKSSVVEVELDRAGTPIMIRETGEDPVNDSHLFLNTLSLSSPNGHLGEIRLWSPAEKMSPEEARLFQTFTSQGALALDRAVLSTNETRVRVLEESDRLKTAILSSVSHELKTPLASIQAAATSLFNPGVSLESEARSELEALLLEETDHMIQLVGNLLNMSRIEAGALKLQRQWNSFAEIVYTGLRRLHLSPAEHPVIVDVPDDLPFVSVDAVLMEQVVINLVRNSIKAAPPHTPVHVSTKVDDPSLLVTVCNEGPHIPDELLQHIFEKFYPVPGKDTSQGTGLGLSICKGVVEAHGGSIWAVNLPVGVAFHFTIPLSWDGIHPVIPDEENEG